MTRWGCFKMAKVKTTKCGELDLTQVASHVRQAEKTIYKKRC
jgi:hypothetical protein